MSKYNFLIYKNLSDNCRYEIIDVKVNSIFGMLKALVSFQRKVWKKNL